MSFSTLLVDTTLCILIIYGLLILVYRRLWQRLVPVSLKAGAASNSMPENRVGEAHSVIFSVIIPARNEQENIQKCIESILQGSYPKDLYEIIVVDDFSTDRTAAILQSLKARFPAQVKIIELAKLLDSRPINSYKKKALALAIEASFGEWVLTTDADCILPPDWLAYYNSYIGQTGKRFVAAPVRFIDTRSFVGRFQCLDFLSLQGVTGAAVAGGLMSMCNGANLGYEKRFFQEVNGFEGVDNLASGDDMFLMQKMQDRQPGSAGYLFAQGAIVDTLPMPDWRSFINQRIRWASKAGTYRDYKIKLVLLIVYLLNLSLVILFFTGLLHPVILLKWLILVGIKYLIEFFFMWKVSAFFNQRNLMGWFLVMQPLHLVYTVVAGWLGLFGKYQWKGRQVK
jgi:cellulose synthase/poly-beta-1,6-N-acetylglucosamine synthase-like glycosyltransferase